MGVLSKGDLCVLHAALKQRQAEVGAAVIDRLHRHGLETHDDAALPNRRLDTDDDAAADAATQLDIASVARNASELAMLEAALQRMSDGGYGECAECGDAIAIERLHANPAATRCTDCQQFSERAARVARATHT